LHELQVKKFPSTAAPQVQHRAMPISQTNSICDRLNIAEKDITSMEVDAPGAPSFAHLYEGWERTNLNQAPVTLRSR
jgi:hypothetical protein